MSISISPNNYMVHFIIGFGFGIYWFFRGFKRFRLKRLIEDIPTSRVQSIAMGLVEVTGEAIPIFKIKTPVSLQDCVYYVYRIDEYHRSKNRGHWTPIAHGNSAQYSFYLKDETGYVLISPLGAEVELSLNLVYETNSLGPPAEQVINFFEEKQIKFRNWLFNKKLRIYEGYIMTNQPIYIMGYAKPWKTQSNAPEIKQLKRMKWQQELTRLWRNKKELEKYDLNHDGRIDATEWEKAKQAVAKEVQAKYGAGISNLAMIEKNREGEIFYISTKSEKELLTQLNIACSFSIIGGAILSLACLAGVIYQVSARKFF